MKGSIKKGIITLGVLAGVGATMLTPSNDPVSLIIDTNDVKEVQRMFKEVEGQQIYVGAYADLSPEVKAEIKTHTEISEGYWLYRDTTTKETEQDKIKDLTEKSSSKQPKEVKTKPNLITVPEAKVAGAARLFTTGFEWQSVTAGVEWTTTTGSPTANTTIKHSGQASLRANTTAATAFLAHNFRANAIADAYERTYLYIASAPGADTTFLAYCDSASFCGSKVKLTSGRQLKCTNSDGSLTTTGSATLSTATWYRIDMFYDETNNQCTVKIDGTTDISAATVDDIGGGGRIQAGVVDTNTTDLYLDDIGANDTSGAAAGFASTGQQSYLGAGNIVIATTTAAGDNNCTTGNHTMISEIPPSNTLTSGSTMCELDVDGMVADFNVTDTSNAMIGIDSYDTISLVYIMIRTRDDTAGANTYTLRYKSAASGVTLTSAAGDPGDATTVRSNTVGTTAFSRMWATTTDPKTGAAWTPTGTNSIDNMQIGVGAPDATPDVWVPTIALMIEYVDGAAPGGTTPLQDDGQWFQLLE